VVDEFEFCYRALGARDQRFDGWFFTAVTSTGIYCRPSCPARTPRREHVRFYPSAAACQQAGFRACKRCRPDATPGSPEWNARGDVVARAMRLIADGVIDREGVPGLARALGYSVRQVERLLMAELGAGPLALARAQRAQTARMLIEKSALSMTEVAFAAGFESIRQFNDTVRVVFALTPTELRRRAARGAAGRSGASSLDVKLAFRRPLSPGNLFGHLAATAIPGVEETVGDTYRRTVRLPHGAGVVELTPADDHVACRLRLADLRDLSAAITRCRWLLDLDADPYAIDEQLSSDAVLGRRVAAAPGRRVPRSVDGAEMAIRAVLGQQISTGAARVHAARLVARYGEPVDDPNGTLTHVFPGPEALHAVDLPMPAGRLTTLKTLVGALAAGELDLSPGGERERARAALEALPGIGPWTSEIIAMRALGDPDAFPLTDLGIRRGARVLGLGGDRAGLLARAERWRPWRAYAVQHLWAATRHPINDWPPVPAPAPARGRRAAAAPLVAAA
jgi:AraC family transcriptional regulator, regulatory protein of adaptative response / DNA-3-methyladenine glycosylase II